MGFGAPATSFRIQRVRRRRVPAPAGWWRRLTAIVGAVVLATALLWFSGDGAGTAQAAEQRRFDCGTTSSGTYSVPAGTTRLLVRMAGAKGENGGHNNLNAMNAGSAGSGAILSALVPVVGVSQVTVRVGCGQSGFHSGGGGGGSGSHSGCVGSAGNGGTGGGSTRLSVDTDSFVEAGGGGGGGGPGCYGDGGNGGAGSQAGNNGAGGNGAAAGGGGAGGDTTSSGDTGGNNASNNGGGGGGGGGGCRYGRGGDSGGGAGGGGGGGGGGGSSCWGTDTATTVESGTNDGGGFLTIDPIGLDVTVTASDVEEVNNDGMPSAGDVIHYTVVITNTGSVHVSDLGLVDAMTAPRDVPVTMDCPVGSLNGIDPGGGFTCTGEYHLTTPDFDRGFISNTATISGELPALPGSGQGTSVSVSASATTPLTAVDRLVVANSVSLIDDPDGDGPTAGDVIHYQVLVTNNGNSTVARVTVTEQVTGAQQAAVDLTCTSPTSGRITVRGTMTCEGDYTVTEADVDTASAEITAVANASGRNRDGAGDPVTAPQSRTSTDLAVRPDLTVGITAGDPADTNTDGRVDVGDQIEYTVTVENSGTVSLTGVEPVLSMTAPAGPTPALTCAPPSPADLGPGDGSTCTGAYVITQADLDKGEVTASVTATGKDRGGHDVHPSLPDSTTTPLTQSSGLRTTKSVAGIRDGDGNGKLDVGDAIDYAIVVTNTGTVSLNQVTVLDELDSPATPDPEVSCTPNAGATLRAGDVMNCTASYVVTTADVNKGTVTNSATANAVTPGQQQVSSNRGSVTSDLNQVSALATTKTVTSVTDNNHNGANDVGDVINYSVTVVNGGTVTLTQVTVTDELTAPAAPALTLRCSPDTPASLDAGENLSCTGSYTITQADLDHGAVTNTATASGTAPDGTAVESGPGVATTQLTGKPALTVTNEVTSVEDRNSNSAIDAGDMVVYLVTVTNNGSVSLTAVSATETVGSVSPPLTCSPTQPASLAPGDKLTCTGSYKITTDDAAHGSVSGVAGAIATTPSGERVDAAKATVRTAIEGGGGGGQPSAGGQPGGGSGGGPGGGSNAPGRLAHTGTNLLPIVAGGGCLLVLGGGLLLMLRRGRRG